MSYEIFYDKQFIRIPQEKEDKFIPIILAGSNNCFESGSGVRDRRARSWWNWSWIVPKNKIAGTEAEMVASIEAWRQDIIDRNTETNDRYKAQGDEKWMDVYDDKRFGYFASLAINGSTRNTTYGQALGIAKTGAKKSLTIEQLKDEGIPVTVKTGYYSKESLEKAKLESFSITVSSTEHLLEAIEKAEKYREAGVQIEVDISLYEGRTKWLRKKYFPRNRRDYDYESVDEFYTVKMKSGYLVKRTRSGYQYTHYPYLKYKTKGDANRRAKSSGGVVEKVNEQARIKVYS